MPTYAWCIALVCVLVQGFVIGYFEALRRVQREMQRLRDRKIGDRRDRTQW
jgi:uncharacterized protein YneF (UPF0154 family)